MAFDFPASPSENQEYTPAGGPTYIYKSPRWQVKSSLAPVLEAPIDNKQYTRGNMGWNETPSHPIAYAYNYTSTITEPPASGQLRGNSTTFSAITKLWIHNVTRDNRSGDDAVLTLARRNSILTIIEPNPNVILMYDVTGPTVAKSGYYEVPVAWKPGGVVAGLQTGDTVYLNIFPNTIPGLFFNPTNGHWIFNSAADGSGTNVVEFDSDGYAWFDEAVEAFAANMPMTAPAVNTPAMPYSSSPFYYGLSHMGTETEPGYPGATTMNCFHNGDRFFQISVMWDGSEVWMRAYNQTVPGIDGGWYPWKKIYPAGAYVGDLAPANPAQGQFWWQSSTGDLFIYYDDGTSTQWVQVNG